MTGPLDLLWPSIPAVLLPFIVPAILLALTIYFVSDNRRKKINERATYDIFLNSCLFSLAFLITYVFILLVSALLFPSLRMHSSAR